MKNAFIAATFLGSAVAQAAPNSVVCSDDKFQFTLVSSTVFETDGALKPNRKTGDGSTASVEINNRVTGAITQAAADIQIIQTRGTNDWVLFRVGSNRGVLKLQILLTDDMIGYYGINKTPLITPDKLTCTKGADAPARSDRLPNINVLAEKQMLIDVTRETVSKAAEALSKQTPKNVDQDTTLLSATANDLQLIYRYRLDIFVNNVNFNNITADVVQRACTAEAAKSEYAKNLTKLQFQIGMTRKYLYEDKDGNIIGAVIIDKNSCNF